jgi:hypothetical protein
VFFVKIQGSSEFLELLNYFSIEKRVEYVYSAVDLWPTVHGSMQFHCMRVVELTIDGQD